MRQKAESNTCDNGKNYIVVSSYKNIVKKAGEADESKNEYQPSAYDRGRRDYKDNEGDEQTQPNIEPSENIIMRKTDLQKYCHLVD